MKANRVALSLALVGAAALTAISIGSMHATAQEKDQSAHPSKDDISFAHKAAQGGAAEVKLGRLAEEKGSSEAVKQFGKEMVTDHSKANETLKAVAAKEGITLPAGLSVADRLTYARLSKLSGADFDRAYADDMVKDHEADISDFQKESDGGKNEAIQNFATQTLPTLQHHLQNARAMRDAAGK
jgi:putative membrane protein